MTTDSPDLFPTQVRHPWRTTLRTVLVAVLALLPVLPDLADAADVDHLPVVASILTVTAAITRIMAHPAVNRWLLIFVPWLAAEPYIAKHRKE